MILFLTVALFVVCLLQSVLLYSALSTIQRLTSTHFRELVSLRHYFGRVDDEQRAEIRSLTESLVRTEGKVYLHPHPDSNPEDDTLPASPSSFRMRPNPPFVKFKGAS